MPLEGGQEIFNTFGELGNAELICKYGFALPDNPFSSVTLDKGSYLSGIRARQGSEACQERVTYLEDRRYQNPQRSYEC